MQGRRVSLSTAGLLISTRSEAQLAISEPGQGSELTPDMHAPACTDVLVLLALLVADEQSCVWTGSRQSGTSLDRLGCQGHVWQQTNERTNERTHNMLTPLGTGTPIRV